MADQPNRENEDYDPIAAATDIARIAERSQKILADYLAKQSLDNGNNVDPLNLGSSFLELTKKMMEDPMRLWQAQAQLWQDYMTLWQASATKFLGGESEPVIEPEPGDRRFKAESWSENAAYDFIKQSYLLTANWLQSSVHDVEGLDKKTAQKVAFYTKQFVDAIAPSNFVMTNPEVMRATLDSKGENLIKGLENVLDDLERGKGKLAIKMTDTDAFKIGENIATTDGKVVFQNDLIQLLQYTPRTKEVYKTPLLIIPPWINKFYILDLRENNSFIRWAVDQGHTVFVISWVNPDESLAQKTFEDYLAEGFFAAMDAMEKATGGKNANVIGYCLGGTLFAAALAYMAATDDNRVKSATFFTTLTDFEDAGDLTVFIDEEQLTSLEDRMAENGYLKGSEMATTFNMLRANDLIWSFVINNYLLGKDPFPFDLLYWNSDSTRMPAAMHSFYLRRMYQDNELVKPDAIVLRNVAIDLTKIKNPVFILSTKDDHIAPWKATYAATQLYGGPVKFVLSGSGHIAGVVNPPAAKKYQYWTNAKTPKNPDTWFTGAKEHPGSWWPEWAKWVAKFGGDKVPARKPGDGKLKAIEDAPGSFVKVSATD